MKGKIHKLNDNDTIVCGVSLSNCNALKWKDVTCRNCLKKR